MASKFIDQSEISKLRAELNFAQEFFAGDSSPSGQRVIAKRRARLNNALRSGRATDAQSDPHAKLREFYARQGRGNSNQAA
jgi:hypothetical protein